MDPATLSWLIPSAISAIGGLGSLFGKKQDYGYSNAIKEILAGRAGGLSPEFKQSALAQVRKDIDQYAGQQRTSAGEDYNVRNLYDSGLLTNQYQDISKSAIGAFGRARTDLEYQDTQMRHQALMQVLGMGNPGAAQNQGWGNLFGAGLSGLMAYFNRTQPTSTPNQQQPV